MADRRSFTLKIEDRDEEFEWRDNLGGWYCMLLGVIVYPPERKRYSSGMDDVSGADGMCFASEGHKTRKGAALAALKALQEQKKGIRAMTFHWTMGWYFSRLPNGDVEVRNHGNFEKPDPNHPPGDGRTTLVIPAPQWASIVCSVSRDGETGERWNAAQDFHGR